MVLKSEIEIAYSRQQKNLANFKSPIIREYLEDWKKREYGYSASHIEVVTGVRRCGKSTLLKSIIQKAKGQIAYFNFEDARVFDFEVSDFSKLDEIMGDKVKAYFFDEIQNVPSWELFIRELHERGAKIYLTGSNASLLSRELGTRLTGRHLRHELFPFSYAEFLKFKKIKNSPKAFDLYKQKGGFPEYLAQDNEEVLQHLLKDVVLRDIAIRHSVKNTKTLMELSLHLISNVGKETTYHRLKNLFSIGSANSVSDYLAWLEDSYLLFFLPKFSYSAKSSAISPRKVYAIDNGLINANSLSFNEDKGRLLENLVYLHLRQNEDQVYYFKEKKECDFVVFDRKKCKYIIQVCDEVNNDNKKREIEGLIEAMIFFDKKESLILTQHQKDNLKVEDKTIRLVPVSEFMLTW